MIFNKYLKYIPLLGIVVIALCVGFVSVKADKNFFLYKVKGIAQNNYEGTAIINAGNKYVNEYVSNFPYTKFFIDFNGTIRNYLHQNNMNNVTKLNNGYLSTLNRKLSDKELDVRAERLELLNDICKKNKIDFLLLQPSYDISKYDPQLPVGYSDYTNQNIDGLLERLNKKNISYIDLREEMQRDGLNIYDYYYMTDHHWNMRGGFYAFKKIVNWISEKTNYPYDNVTTDINNYEIKLYPQWHMGSRAQRTGEKFAGKADDYELFVPKFTTRILNNKDKTVKSFYESLVNDSIFKTRPEKTNRYTYDSAYEKNDINDLESLDSKTPLTILFLGDSYSRGVKPFMLLTYKHFYFVWGNYNINELINKYSPDVVIVETYPENLQDENIYKF